MEEKKKEIIEEYENLLHILLETKNEFKRAIIIENMDELRKFLMSIHNFG